jgi:hypothetical protein
MTPADVRHLRRMLECISGMRSQSVSLVQGADTLLFLRNALEEIDQPWADAFTSHLATLESAGTASRDQIATMGSRFADVVADALDALERMVCSRFPGGLPPTEEADADP